MDKFKFVNPEKYLQERPWPFDLTMLTAGLRKKTNDLSLRVLEISEFQVAMRFPSVGRLRGMQVDCAGASGEIQFKLVVKEARQAGSTRAASFSNGFRETCFYRQLAEQTPMRVPEFYAAGADGSWLILGYLEPALNFQAWKASDYFTAVHNLVELHDRFWGLGEDLSIYPWLLKPLSSDFSLLMDIGITAAERLVDDGWLPHAFPSFTSLLNILLSAGDHLVGELRKAPLSLIHGDYWSGNIYLDSSGNQTVLDWQQVGIGAGVLDLFRLIQNSLWKMGALPIGAEALIEIYRQDIKEKTGKIWSDQEWQELWDSVLLWEFLVHWMEITAHTPRPLLEINYPQEEELWLKPAYSAVGRLFGES